MSDNGVYQRLAERFAPEAHRVKDIGSAKLTYVDGETVISRLNEVLGVDGWSFEVKDIHILENEVWALGRLTAVIDGKTVVREQVGGQIINRKRSGEIIELSNDIKGAITDCAKKCATLVGIGLYLYDPSERREVEQERRGADKGVAGRGIEPQEPGEAEIDQRRRLVGTGQGAHPGGIAPEEPPHQLLVAENRRRVQRRGRQRGMLEKNAASVVEGSVPGRGTEEVAQEGIRHGATDTRRNGSAPDPYPAVRDFRHAPAPRYCPLNSTRR